MSDVVSVRTQQPMAPASEAQPDIPMHDPSDYMPHPIGITITPATPAVTPDEGRDSNLQLHSDVNSEKRSSSLERDRDISRGKKVREVLKSGVHKGQARITTISKKIGHGVGRHSSLSLKRTISAPGGLP